MHYTYDNFGWLAAASESPTARSTTEVPTILTLPAVAGELHPNFSGYEWVNRAYVEPAAAVTVPQSVTMRQARLALLGAGRLASVESAIAAMPGAQGDVARIEWEFSSEVRRAQPLVAALAPVLGMTEGQIDELFIAASAL